MPSGERAYVCSSWSQMCRRLAELCSIRPMNVLRVSARSGASATPHSISSHAAVPSTPARSAATATMRRSVLPSTTARTTTHTAAPARSAIHPPLDLVASSPTSMAPSAAAHAGRGSSWTKLSVTNTLSTR